MSLTRKKPKRITVWFINKRNNVTTVIFLTIILFDYTVKWTQKFGNICSQNIRNGSLVFLVFSYHPFSSPNSHLQRENTSVHPGVGSIENHSNKENDSRYLHYVIVIFAYRYYG